MSPLCARVAIDGSTYSFDKLYDYAVPASLCGSCAVGRRVIVPFGRSNSKRSGYIIKLEKADPAAALKPVLRVEDDRPLLSEEMLSLALWMKEHAFCTYSDAFRTILPAGLNLTVKTLYAAARRDDGDLPEDLSEIFRFILSKKDGVEAAAIAEVFGLSDVKRPLDELLSRGYITEVYNSKRRVGDATVKTARLVDDGATSVKLTPKQRDVVNLLRDAGTLSLKEISYFTGAGTVVMKNLEKYGVIRIFESEIYRTPDISAKKDLGEIILTGDQRAAYEGICRLFDSGKYSPALLHGVTGSGKTQVFLKLAERAIACGREVIIMVPEISLTPQMLEIFYSRFGGQVAVFHSLMSLGRRLDEWKKVKNGKAKIAIGTRSAVFAPFENLGLIVMDEEQEHTYKSEQSPRFHAREVAKFRASYNKCVCLFSSATPSLETYSAAKAGNLSLFTLPERYGSAVLPEVITVDMRAEQASGNTGNLSVVLAEELSNTIKRREQAILLLNRRGHNTYVSCPSCGYVATCKNCSISMTYHSANGRLMCHYCGYSEPYGTRCPQCGSGTLKYSGAGTQKLEDELSLLLPEARVLRLDADTTMAQNAFSEKLSAFSRGEYDILVGTQMVAKGLDFPKVTLVGVLNADRSMYSEDFRGFERTFSLLTQVIGRSGRGDRPGRAYIQTQNPESPLIKYAEKQDYEAFYNDEILTRKLMIYPPYCDIVSVLAASPTQADSDRAANFIADELRSRVERDFSDVKLIVLRPTPPAVPRVNNKYRCRIIIKCKNNRRFRELLCGVLEEYFSKARKNVSLTVDVNPEGSV